MHRVFRRSGRAVAALVGSMLALVLSFTWTVQPSFAHETGAYSHDADKKTDNPDWMAELPATVPLSELSLPGTHDTMAQIGTDLVLTQTLSLADQLASGIRVLDIRCRHIADVFAMHHGAIFLGTFFGDDVLAVVIEFLQAHPTETVLMNIQEEHDAENNTRTFTETFESYMTIYGAQHFWTPTSNPTLADVRGKIVVLDQFSPLVESGLTKYGLHWDSLNIQNFFGLCFQPELHNKWELVKAHIDAANTGDEATIYVNFLSASTIGGCPLIFPYFVASGHSSPGTAAGRLSTGSLDPPCTRASGCFPDFPRIDCSVGNLVCTVAYEGTNILANDYLAGTRPWRSGIIYADFPGPDLINTIIGLNVFDTDKDGIPDAEDNCLFTAAGATVNTDGCSIADLNPCANDWKNHGAYVSSVAHTAEDFVAADLITEAEKDAIVSEAARSSCGK